MTKEQIFKEVHLFLKGQLRNGEKLLILRMEDRLVEDLCVDSLDMIELWIKAEELSDVSISQEEIEGTKTIEDVVEFIYDRINKKD